MMLVNELKEILSGYPDDSSVVIGIGDQPYEIFEIHSIEQMTCVSDYGAYTKVLLWTGESA